MKNLIINADDFGISHQRNLAISQLLVHKFISSATLLVNFQSSYQAFQFSKKNHFNVGIHLNLTQGKSLKNHNTLTDQKGYFHGKYTFYNKFKEGSINLNEIQIQLRCQVNFFLQQMNRLPINFDSHNHIHLIPEIAQIIGHLMTQQFGIYKCRICNQIKDQTTQFLVQVKKNSKVSSQIYQKYLIISPQYFIGLRLTGKNFAVQNIAKDLQQINQQGQIQFMSHPGYLSKSGDQFNQSNDRLIQASLLKSKEFLTLLSSYKSISYKDIKSKRLSRKINVMIVSKYRIGTGNYITALRYKNILSQLGYKVYLKNILEQFGYFLQFVKDFNIQFCIGLNLYKSGKYLMQLYKIYGIPFYLFVTGTDVYQKINNQQDCNQIINFINHSQVIISLNQQMLEILKSKKINFNHAVIEPSILQTNYDSDVAQNLLASLGLQNKKFCLFTASIRPIKDNLFLIFQFKQLKKKYGLEVIHCGPIIDQQFQSSIKQQFKQIKQIGVLKHQLYIQLLSKSYCIINTSLNEGMNNSLLQGQANKVLVIARNNQGNRNIVSDLSTGLLFDTAKQFMTKFDMIFQNQKLYQQITNNAFQHIKIKHNFDQQKSKFKFHLQQIQKNYTFVQQDEIRCYTPVQFIHPISQANINLFKKIQIKPLKSIKILDMGCGSSIMTIYAIKKCLTQLVTIQKVSLVDISDKILNIAKYNIIKNTNLQESKIKCFNSNLFQKIGVQQKYNLVLANLPQCPSLQKIRVDKYGGKQGSDFNNQFIKQVKQYLQPQAIIYQIISHLSNTKQYFKKCNEQYKVDISGKQIHRIKKKFYQEMNKGLFNYLNQLKNNLLIQFIDKNDYIQIQTTLVKLSGIQ